MSLRVRGTRRMSDEETNVRLFPFKKKEKTGQRTVDIRDIDCLAILTNKEEQFYIDDPSQIAQIMAFIKQRGFKWKEEVWPE